MNPDVSPAKHDTDPRDLGVRQRLHVRLCAKLIAYLYDECGLEATWGETYRPPAMALLNAKSGAGIANSLHCLRLALDLQMFKNGEYQHDVAVYKIAADYWLTLDPLCAAGYYFHSVDADHYSITYHGVM